LDSYLRGRANESLEEMPLLRAENQQYIHYRKGSIVMLALRDRIGEQNMNKALKGLIAEYKFSETVQASTLDLVAAFKSVASPKDYAFIDAQFNQISIYDLKIVDTLLLKKIDGEFSLTLTVSAKQFEADGKGEETEQPFDEFVDIVLFSQDPNDFGVENELLYRKKHRLISGENTITITTKLPFTYGRYRSICAFY